jgi:hypothetical protein
MPAEPRRRRRGYGRIVDDIISLGWNPSDYRDTDMLPSPFAGGMTQRRRLPRDAREDADLRDEVIAVDATLGGFLLALGLFLALMVAGFLLLGPLRALAFVGTAELAMALGSGAEQAISMASAVRIAITLACLGVWIGVLPGLYVRLVESPSVGGLLRRALGIALPMAAIWGLEALVQHLVIR